MDVLTITFACFGIEVLCYLFGLVFMWCVFEFLSNYHWNSYVLQVSRCNSPNIVNFLSQLNLKSFGSKTEVQVRYYWKSICVVIYLPKYKLMCFKCPMLRFPKSTKGKHSKIQITYDSASHSRDPFHFTCWHLQDPWIWEPFLEFPWSLSNLFFYLKGDYNITKFVETSCLKWLFRSMLWAQFTCISYSCFREKSFVLI